MTAVDRAGHPRRRDRAAATAPAPTARHTPAEVVCGRCGATFIRRSPSHIYCQPGCRRDETALTGQRRLPLGDPTSDLFATSFDEASGPVVGRAARGRRKERP
jgi:hypothetical protein